MMMNADASPLKPLPRKKLIKLLLKPLMLVDRLMQAQNHQMMMWLMLNLKK
jgi:hypothetical protein